MAIRDQKLTPEYAIYNGDCVEVSEGLPSESIDFCIYSPPFAGLYNYSSDDKDMSNCATYEEFFDHYEYIVKEIGRLLKPGRLAAVHCQDVKDGEYLRDLPGDIIRLHEKHGMRLHCRTAIWKEPLTVAIRTRSLGLTHRQIVKDSSKCTNAGADYLVVFRKKGTNKEPIAHPEGLTEYAGARFIPEDLMKYKGHTDQKTNKLSHWIWQQYASCFWDDIRLGEVIEYKKARDPEDEKHVHPLQLDVIDRCLTLWSNPGDVVFTPFMGVGSEVYGAIKKGRKGMGAELKQSYYNQAIKNLDDLISGGLELSLAL
tara:strand:- start:37 stop:975 length:939 start_codon:yes stop_codon:yes gene_type:complete